MCALLLGLDIASAPKAVAAEPREPMPLQVTPKSGIAISAPSHSWAPFVLAASPAPELALLPPNTLRQDPGRSSCGSGRALCYNPASGQIDFRPARDLMPDLPGLTRENISVNRHGIIFRYSF
jgi:hypothetical protein